MDAVTYPDDKVGSFLKDRVIPVRVLYNHKPLADDFNVQWTPTIVTLNEEGKESHRTVGFLAPEELIPSLLLGIGKSLFEGGRFEEAISAFDELLSEYPKSDSAPEAIYLRGVSLYKNTHDAKPLKGAYEKLAAEYPDTQWTKRAYPYRLL
jgi:tetratricopeptide (TPR) repeat protein